MKSPPKYSINEPRSVTMRWYIYVCKRAAGCYLFQQWVHCQVGFLHIHIIRTICEFDTLYHNRSCYKVEYLKQHGWIYLGRIANKLVEFPFSGCQSKGCFLTISCFSHGSIAWVIHRCSVSVRGTGKSDQMLRIAFKMERKKKVYFKRHEEIASEALKRASWSVRHSVALT